jgi:ATP-dependent DNA ligase
MATAEFVEPMLCLAAEKILECPAWQYELKLDGYRAISVRTKAGVEPWSGQLWSQRPSIDSVMYVEAEWL